ncbi:efflux RND transporter permease subunit [Myxococcus sp. RHSTA-1-4]|uniref:efflux RND transporter permease subunit n=1 Tax=Myxococcus sp. RHSTA-1-4 TaxID=2874601 RepID=UPI001CC0413C|nr:CusA/CzcA family heavy metal efflux RND transporter [Myxococcus sp. RHSTA-1-4]MBZ4416818.1 CusA/CzcA family heavy metal efflux RND transporter [Myxococcus sp. RHSTA-1-4]
MMGRLVELSVRYRGVVLGVTAALAVVAALVGWRLELDALPDITTNQVLVLTRAPGMTPEEVERLVTRPIETGLGGIPGLLEHRSLSRYGISSVTAVFSDDVDPYRARQGVQERLSGLASRLPPGVDAPELGPLTGGLGEIFHFTLSSESLTPARLLELAELRVAPLLRSVPGVVEVNTWGGHQRTLEVRADPRRLAARGLTLEDVRQALEGASGSVPGASLPVGDRQVLVRAVARPPGASELGGAVVRTPGGEPVRVADVADVVTGALPRIGTATANGRGETVYVMVQMLRGANALDVVQALHARMPEVKEALPRDVRVDIVYDRSVLVRGTLHTVAKNLAEGGLLVVLVLLALLGSFRAGLLVASVIPLSMLGASVGMVLLGIPGNLMSLGAIDFGLLVDGAVVMVEGLFHHVGHSRHRLDASGWQQRVGEVTSSLARPVFFSVLIIMLVYVPVLSLTGVDGKMFRPMALTVVLALATSLVLALTFIPAAASLVLRPEHVPEREPWLVRAVQRAYPPLLERALRHPAWVAGGALVLLALGVFEYVRAGTEFAPQLSEGDLVVQTTRAADIRLEGAAREAGRLEAVLLGRVPEVTQVVSRVGSPAVATDIMGLEQADVFVALKPREQWRPGLTPEGLVEEMQRILDEDAPGGEPSFTQPIQMRFNELLGGSVADVAVSVYGEDLGELRRLAERVAALVDEEKGAEDVRVLAPPEVSLLEVEPRPLDAARAGFSVREVLEAVQAVRTGLEVGATFDGAVRVPILLRLGGTAEAFSLADLALPAATGGTVPLSRVADVRLTSAPSLVSRQDGQRRLVVGFNVRGADLGTVVAGAQARIAKGLEVPSGYRLVWGGQYETLTAAARRLSLVIPAVLGLIVLVLVVAFGRLRPAVIIFTHVPFACVGGVLALSLRGMPVSISAAIGFIALSGIAVLNGVVWVSRLLHHEAEGMPIPEAVRLTARERVRPVLMTALVAALGFVPMMLAQGVGAEVQRPLATVVVGGLVTSTLLTLGVLPALYPWLSRRRPRAAKTPAAREVPA